MTLPIGELAALTTAICWAITPIMFTRVGEKIGSINVNRIRILLAVVFMLITHWIMFGTIFPSGLSHKTLFYLSASGVIGLVIGDTFIYQSYLDIGPRKTLLLMTLAPVFSVILAIFVIGETLHLIQTIGILVTIIGIGIVIISKKPNNNQGKIGSRPLRGFIFGILAALGQAVGLILAKLGMADNLSPMSVSLVRMCAACVFIWLIALTQKNLIGDFKKSFKKELASKLVVGSLLGPFLGVTLSMVAINFAKVGIASTLMSLSPVLMIPLTKHYLKDSPGHRGIWGAIIAVLGAAILLFE